MRTTVGAPPSAGRSRAEAIAAMKKAYRRTVVLPLLYWRAKGVVDRAMFRYRSAVFDHTMGVETTRSVDRKALDVAPAKREQAWSYHACDVNRFYRIMSAIDLAPAQTTFVDIGSGKGRALFMADRLKLARLVGVELSPGLHAAAEKNVASYRRVTGSTTPIDLENVDATEYELPSGRVVVFMFNPFQREVMERFATKLSRAGLERGSDLTVVYVHPVVPGPLESAPGLVKVHEDRGSLDFMVFTGAPRV